MAGCRRRRRRRISANIAWDYNAAVQGNITWPSDASHLFTLDTRGQDNALAYDGSGSGNIGPLTTYTFVIDNIAPAGSITWPRPNASVSSTTIAMTGPATDDLAGVHILQVEISTNVSGTTTSYWTAGNTWSNSQTWISTTVANPWVYTIPASALPATSGTLYRLRLQLTDFAGNAFTTQVTTFTYDTQLPVVVISSPIAGGFYSAVQVSTPFIGTAVDNGALATGVSTVTLTLQDMTSTAFVFTSSPAAGTLPNWSYNPPISFTNGHQYQLTATATDNATNPASTSTLFIYDVQAPTSAVTSPNTVYITTWTTISGNANDLIGAPANKSGIATTGVAVAIQKVGGSWWDGSPSPTPTPSIKPPSIPAVTQAPGPMPCLRTSRML